ncbi:hypothetical protein ACFFU9_08925 [Mariniflexile ostreae]|uniref:Ricin-type beta-trefoil lectin protein n=1 Tax=Mariniflexile ostreae TaxID=1520892 RepID=A0ABV5FBM4_9FLAO
MRLLNIFIALLIFSCNSVPKDYLVNSSICNYNDSIFKITKDDITLNIIDFKKRYNNKDTIFIDNRNFKNQYWNLSNGYITNQQKIKR